MMDPEIDVMLLMRMPDFKARKIKKFGTRSR